LCIASHGCQFIVCRSADSALQFIQELILAHLSRADFLRIVLHDQSCAGLIG